MFLCRAQSYCSYMIFPDLDWLHLNTMNCLWSNSCKEGIGFYEQYWVAPLCVCFLIYITYQKEKKGFYERYCGMHCPCVFEISQEKARKIPVGFLLCFYPQVMMYVHVVNLLSYCLWTNIIMSLSSGGKPSTWWRLGWCWYKTWYWFIKFCNGQQGMSFLLSWNFSFQFLCLSVFWIWKE